MVQTPNLQLPYIMAAQAQKHVTHNDAIRALDAIVQTGVLDRNLTSPPATPVDGDRYIVAGVATGDWASKENQIAAWQDGAWMFYIPREGWLAWVFDSDELIVWDGTNWITAAGTSTSLNPATGDLIGINATADSTNRLSLSSAASLFNHAGAGHQQKINKNAIGDTASQLYQTGFSGRAEIGLTGNDDFHFKVSPDGTSWKDAIQIAAATGLVTFPFTSFAPAPNLLINGDFQINQRQFAGGALAPNVFGLDRWKGAIAGADLSVSGYLASLNSGEIEQLIDPDMWGYDSFASQTVSISIDAPSQDLTITFGAQSGTIAAGAGRQTVSLTLGALETGPLALKIMRSTAGGVTFGRVKLELAPASTPWQARSKAVEEQLAKSYFERRYYANDVFVGLVAAISSDTALGAIYYAPKRTAPSVAVSDPTGFGLTGVSGETVTAATFANPQLASVKITVVISPSSLINNATYAITGLAATPYIDINAEL